MGAPCLLGLFMMSSLAFLVDKDQGDSQSISLVPQDLGFVEKLLDRQRYLFEV